MQQKKDTLPLGGSGAARGGQPSSTLTSPQPQTSTPNSTLKTLGVLNVLKPVGGVVAPHAETTGESKPIRVSNFGSTKTYEPKNGFCRVLFNLKF